MISSRSLPLSLVLIAGLFLALGLLSYTQENPMIALLPMAVVAGLAIIWFPKQIIWLLVFCTPISINLESYGLEGIAFYFPTEPLLLVLAVLIVLVQFYKPFIQKSVLNHPISVSLLVYLIWSAFTALTSVDKVVSLKNLLAKLWFIIPLTFALASTFIRDKNRIPNILMTYFVPFSLVCLYTLIRHAGHGFAEEPAHWVMEPFFRDHTQLGAVLGIFIPIAVGFILDKELGKTNRMLCTLGLAILVFVMLYTYSRAALLSIVLAAGILAVVKLKVPIWLIFTGAMTAIVILILSLNTISRQLERNDQDSSDNLVENVESITNISTDASNLERINRWKCAYKMWLEKPLLGWGPGTYMFYYAPFQEAKDLTIISTNFGDVGNAHSEYLSPLAESGLPGMLLFITLVVLIFVHAAKAYRAEGLGKREKHYLLFITLGLSTYFFHGLLNNFLDADKAAVPVWMMIGMIIAYHIHAKTKQIDHQLPSLSA